MVLGQVGLIDDIDMCILAGNVIDNAIEAAAKCSDPYVNVEITAEEEYSWMWRILLKKHFLTERIRS